MTKIVSVRSNGSGFIITYNGVEHEVKNFKECIYMIGWLTGSHDVLVNGIPVDKWILL